MRAIWRRLPARSRLTLWYILLLTGTQLALFGLGLWLVARTLYSNLDEGLQARAAAAQTAVDTEKGRVTFTSDDTPKGQAPPVVALLDVVRLWDKSYRPAFDRSTWTDFPTPEPADLDRAVSGEAILVTDRAPDGSNVRLLLLAAKDHGKTVGAMEIGRSLADVDAILAQLRIIGGVGLVLALALTWAGGYFLAGRALAPVDSITRAARRIGAEDLSQRLGLDLPDDELGRLAAAFDGMIDRLDQAFQRQRRFTADASHELRTPLAVIRAQVEIARERARDPRYDAGVFESVNEECQRLGHLVESLLALARADTGTPLSLHPVDLEEMVADVSEQIAPRAYAQQVKVMVATEETAPVNGDPAWLRQLLTNLLDNALRYTPPGGEISLMLRAAQGGVELAVSDTGEGIPAEHLPRIFERFYRVDRARSRAAGGSGLGLAICAWVAGAHGGRIEVDSKLGEGSTFKLWLPARRSSPPAPPITTAAPGGRAVPSGRRV